MKKNLKQKCLLMQVRHALIVGVIMMCAQQALLIAQTPVRMASPNEAVRMRPIDDVQFVVQYETTMITDTLNPEKKAEESMILKIGSVSSSYYSYTRFVTDSILEEQFKKNGFARINRDNADKMGEVTYHIYKNYPTGKVTTLDKIAISRFRCEEENEMPVWELLPDTMTILSYSCQKAICNFKGRDYEAWFTQEIPKQEGPWKLHGLPGLILKASDSQGHYTFECTGLQKTNEKLMFGADGYESISRKNLNKVYERFAADPVGYMTSISPNVRIAHLDENGENKTIKNTPYNPIERTE